MFVVCLCVIFRSASFPVIFLVFCAFHSFDMSQPSQSVSLSLVLCILHPELHCINPNCVMKTCITTEQTVFEYLWETILSASLIWLLLNYCSFLNWKPNLKVKDLTLGTKLKTWWCNQESFKKKHLGLFSEAAALLKSDFPSQGNCLKV